jgi:hypothetical protein
LGDNVNTKGDYLEMGVYFTEDDDYIGAIIRRVIRGV